MSEFKHDPEINIQISTPTNVNNNQIRQRPRFEIYFEFVEPRNTNLLDLLRVLDDQYSDSDLTHILNYSQENDGELERDSTVQLDIEERECNSSEVGQPCVVCQYPIETAQIVSTIDSCGHTFHYSCLNEWGYYKQECPTCRKRILILER